LGFKNLSDEYWGRGGSERSRASPFTKKFKSANLGNKYRAIMEYHIT